MPFSEKHIHFSENIQKMQFFIFGNKRGLLVQFSTQEQNDNHPIGPDLQPPTSIGSKDPFAFDCYFSNKFLLQSVIIRNFTSVY